MSNYNNRHTGGHSNMHQQAANSSNHNSANNTQCIEVYAPDTKTLYSVPLHNVFHQGSPSDKGRFLVCRTYSNAIEAGVSPSEVTACAMGNHCRFVHIDVPLSQLKGDVIHVHYVYRSEECCSYESLSKAMIREHADVPKNVIEDFGILVYGPNNREPVERIRAARLLLTGGSRYAFECATNPKRLPGGQIVDQPRVCHCAHYYFTQTCNRGSNCSFIHVISTDPTQKADSIKPANYRRRVAQLGQIEIQQGNMGSPQIQYHSNVPSVQGTPTVGQHVTVGGTLQRQLNISVGMNNVSPNTFNQGTPVTVGRTATATTANQRRQYQVPTTPSIGRADAPNNHQFESKNSSSTTGYKTAVNASSSAEFQDMEGGGVSSSTYSNSYAENTANSHTVTVAGAVVPPPPPLDRTSPLSGGYGHSPYTAAHTATTTSSSIPAPINAHHAENSNVLPVEGRGRSTPSMTMLPMDDVVEGGFDAPSPSSPYGQRAYGIRGALSIPCDHASPNTPATFYSNGHAKPSFGDKTSLYTGGANGAAFTLNSNASDLLQNSPAPLHTSTSFHNGSGYASSAQCSPTGTPSTGMHKLATPKVAAGRYVHNPYAQSPVTAQAQM